LLRVRGGVLRVVPRQGGLHMHDMPSSIFSFAEVLAAFAALCRVARRVRLIRCGFAVTSSVEVAVRRTVA